LLKQLLISFQNPLRIQFVIIEYVLDNITKAPIEDLLPMAERLPKELSIKQFIK